jgi:hypothetical protein
MTKGESMFYHSTVKAGDRTYALTFTTDSGYIRWYYMPYGVWQLVQRGDWPADRYEVTR